MRTKKNIVIVIAILFSVIAFIVYFNIDSSYYEENNNNNAGDKVEEASNEGFSSVEDNNTLIKSEFKENSILEGVPKWAEKIIDIDEDYTIGRMDKIKSLVNMLKDSNNNEEKILLLQTLSKYNPVENVDDIIPYLYDSNEQIQSHALAVLNNSMLPTEEEEINKNMNSNFEENRKKIGEAVNTVYKNPETSEDVRSAILSGYSITNDNPEDTMMMVNNIVYKNDVNSNESAFIANILVSPRENPEEIVNRVKSLSDENKELVVSDIGVNISANPMVVDTLSDNQKNILIDFIRENPPKDKSEDGLANLDLWEMALTNLSD